MSQTEMAKKTSSTRSTKKPIYIEQTQLIDSLDMNEKFPGF